MVVKVFVRNQPDSPIDTYDDVKEVVHGRTNVLVYHHDNTITEYKVIDVDCTVVTKGYSAV